MRKFSSVLLASLLGLSSVAFAASPTDASTRDQRMTQALSDYRQDHSGTTESSTASPEQVKLKHHQKKHHPKKHHKAKQLAK